MTKRKEEGAIEAPPAAKPDKGEPLMEFLLSLPQRQEVEMKGGFLYYARTQGWTHATRADWMSRYEAFRRMEVA